MFANITQLVVALAVSVSGLPTGPDPAGLPRAERYFGMNIQALFFAFPRSAWGPQLDALQRVGVRSVRFDAAWGGVERRPPVRGRRTFDWSRFDPMVAELARREIRWAPIVDYSAMWIASEPGNHRSPPRDTRLYAGFARAVAERYGRGGSFWREHPDLPEMWVADYEIWNAPNSVQTPWPVEGYADAYLAARSAIRAADPQASVSIGGLAWGASDFLRELVRHRPDAIGNIDAVGLHPYAARPDGVIKHVVELRRTMDQLGLANAPIAITEVGWTTQGRQPVPHASERDRARYYARLTELLARSDCGVSALIPHAWVTPERDPSNSEDWFGINHADGGPTATSGAYAGAIRRVVRWLRRAKRADVRTCGRAPRVVLARGRRSGCQAARVTIAGRPLDRARVRFEYLDRAGRTRSSGTETTDSTGRVRHCIERATRGSSAGWRLRVSASRPDLAGAATAALAARRGR